MPVVAGRSKIATQFGIVAASQPLAARAGVQVLERGGHAVDAAVAANAVMGVVEPEMNGIGGDLFAMVSESSGGGPHGLNAGGWAPGALTPGLLKAQGLTDMPFSGIHTVTVPGAVAGWAALHRRFGRLPMADLLAPAIFYAEHGFPVSDVIAARWASGPTSCPPTRTRPRPICRTVGRRGRASSLPTGIWRRLCDGLPAMDRPGFIQGRPPRPSSNAHARAAAR
jgi:gamma-glutamyltranspeptidase